MRYPSTILLYFVFACSAFAETNKNQYWLFKPTPRELMRPMSTDGTGPTAAPTPYTIDSGHVQFEGGFSYGYDSLALKDDSFKFTITSELHQYVPVVRIGVWNRIEAKVSAFYYDQNVTLEDKTFRPPSTWKEERDLLHGLVIPMCLKVNIWGNDAGRVAIALQPWAATRVYSSSWRRDGPADTYGFGIPVQLTLAQTTNVRLMSGVGFHDDDFVDFRGTAQLRHRLADKFDVFAGFTARFDMFAGFTAYGLEYRKWTGLAGVGVAYSFSRNVEFQICSDFDVEREPADKFFVSTTISARF